MRHGVACPWHLGLLSGWSSHVICLCDTSGAVRVPSTYAVARSNPCQRERRLPPIAVTWRRGVYVPHRAHYPDPSGSPPPPVNPLRIILLHALCALTPAVGTLAQVRPDSLLPESLLLGPRQDVGFESPDAESGPVDSLLHFDHDLTTTLSLHAGSFVYDFGALGWPAGWSYLGGSPNIVAAYWHGIPFDDPLTGRARLDLLPTALLHTPAVVAGGYGRPVSVHTQLRSFHNRRPRTELHYQAGDNGLQRVTAMHAQQMQKTILGTTGTLQGLFAYAGAAHRGEYPGSRLKRMRQVMVRSRFNPGAWSLELLYLHNQRRLGAHGGVVPVPSYATVYNRLIASVRDERAVRRDVRHDGSLTLRMALAQDMSPVTVQGWHTYARLRYTQSAQNTTEVTQSRWGVRVRQRFHWGAHRMRAIARAVVQDGRFVWHASLRDSVSIGGIRLTEEVSARAEGSSVVLGFRGAVSYRSHLFLQAHMASVTPSRVMTHGFGQTVDPLPGAPTGRTMLARLGASATWGALSVEGFVFGSLSRRVAELYGARSDSLVVRSSQNGVRRAGAAVDLGVRRRARRGFYAQLQGLWVAPGSGETTLGAAILPRLSGHGRLGIRYTLFRGDLALNLFIRARLWSEMASRTLHSPTGLLVIPEDETLFEAGHRLPASAAVDVVAEAGVRTAVLFVAYENVLSGTVLMAGNQLIPIYPLPATILRFGVFWPIEN